MHPRTLKYGSLAACLPLLAAVLPGQNANVLGPHNADFLESLWRRGYIDEAKQIGELVGASSLPAAEKAAVDSIYTKLKMALAQRDQNPKERRDLVLKVIGEKKAKVEAAKANSEQQIDALGELIDQYRLLADAMVELLAKETDPAQQATMRKEADGQFEAFEKELKDRAAATDKLRDDSKPGSELPYLVSTYGLGRVYYYHSLLFPADDYGGKKLIEKALNVLSEFDLDFGETLAAFEAKLTTALCQNRMGDAQAAIDECNDAIKLRERFEKDRSGVWQVDRNAADVIAAAAVQKTLFLKDQKAWNKIVDTAKDYFATVSKPMEPDQAKALLAAMCEAQIELGEHDAATKTAQQLMEQGGFWVGRGQQLLSQLVTDRKGDLPPDKLLKLAESIAGQGEYDRALQMCRQILLDKTPENAKFAAEAMLVTGAIYATPSRGWYHEASVAFDAVVRRWPKSESAPDALWRAIRCFDELESTEGLSMYKAKINERQQQLIRDYPTDPHVGLLQLLSGQRLERAQKFLEAAGLFEQIAKDSSAYLEAHYYAANCYQQHARKLESTGKAKEAEPFLQKAMEGFQGVLRDTDAAKLSTTDPKAKGRLEQVEGGARIAIANMLISGNPPKPTEAEAVLKNIPIDDNDKQAPNLWALKIRIQQAEGNLDQAADAMAAALDKAGDNKFLQGTSRSLASALDNKAAEKLKANDRLAAEALWRRASNFYLRGAPGATPREIDEIGVRLFAIGLILNDVDTKVDSWFEMPPGWKPRVTEPWDVALQLFERLESEGAANYKARIQYARILGFMGRFDDCEAQLSKLMAEERKLPTGANGTLDRNTLMKKPELQLAYLEYGFSLQRASGDTKAHVAKATDVFQRSFNSAPVDKKFWWYSRYGLMRSYYDSGRYEEADVSMKSLERTNPKFDEGRFGLERQLTQLKTEIALKNPK